MAHHPRRNRSRSRSRTDVGELFAPNRVAPRSLDSVLAYHLSRQILGSPIMDVRALFEIYQQALGSDARIGNCVEADLKAIYERDPACDEYSLPLLYFKGFHAIQSYRITHYLLEPKSKSTCTLFTKSNFSGFRCGYSSCRQNWARHYV